MMVFDPAKNIDAYLQFAKQQDTKIVKTLETHRQADYISGSWSLQRAVGADIVAPDQDFSVARFQYTSAQDGDIHTFSGDGPSVKVIYTPGHTPGSTSYLIDDRYLRVRLGPLPLRKFAIDDIRDAQTRFSHCSESWTNTIYPPTISRKAVTIYRKSGVFRRVLITPDDPMGFVERIKAHPCFTLSPG